MWKPFPPVRTLAEIICCKKCKEQKRQKIYKHDLSVGLKHTAGTSVQEGGGKTAKSPDVFPAEPEIQKPGAGQDFCYGIDLQNDCCGYMRQKTGEQYIRPEKSIIGNIKKAAASTQMHIIRYKAAR